MYTIIINKLELKRKVREDKSACELVKTITWGYDKGDVGQGKKDSPRRMTVLNIPY